MKKRENSFILDTFYGDHPFIVVGQNNFDKISDVVKKCRNVSYYADNLMKCNDRVLLDIITINEDNDGLYSGDTIFINSLNLNKKPDQLFKDLVHEYIHFLQDVNIKNANPSAYKKWAKNYKNTIQDFYLLMINEADAYTKENLIIKEKLSSDDMNKMFFKQLKSLATKINCDRYYHDYFKYLKMKMRPVILHKDFIEISLKMLKSGTKLTGGPFPNYTFSFSEINKVLEETLIENKKFEMLSKVNHWSEDETRIRVLGYPDDYDEIDDIKWKERLDNFCEQASDNKKMKNLLNYLYNNKQI